MSADSSIQFFDTQLQRQVREADLQLNPFEHIALPHLHGRVLDYGCGLGNLACAAARRGLLGAGARREPHGDCPPAQDVARRPSAAPAAAGARA